MPNYGTNNTVMPYYCAGIWHKCSVHLINDGTTEMENSNGTLVNSINWGLSAPYEVAKSQTRFKCKLDDSVEEFDCKCHRA